MGRCVLGNGGFSDPSNNVRLLRDVVVALRFQLDISSTWSFFQSADLTYAERYCDNDRYKGEHSSNRAEDDWDRVRVQQRRGAGTWDVRLCLANHVFGFLLGKGRTQPRETKLLTILSELH